MSGEIIMIKIVGRDGLTYNLNLDEVAAVRYADATLPPERQYDEIWPRGRVEPVQLVVGSFAAAVAALKAEYNTSPKVSNYIFIGTTP